MGNFAETHADSCIQIMVHGLSITIQTKSLIFKNQLYTTAWFSRISICFILILLEAPRILWDFVDRRPDIFSRCGCGVCADVGCEVNIGWGSPADETSGRCTTGAGPDTTDRLFVFWGAATLITLGKPYWYCPSAGPTNPTVAGGVTTCCPTMPLVRGVDLLPAKGQY